MGTRTMRQVVEYLRSENAEALLELFEFEYAMVEVGRSLQALAEALRELKSSVSELAFLDAPVDPAAIRALEDHTAVAADRAEQIALALAEFSRGMKGWGISEG